jgi:hypothetical protein
MSKLEPRLGMDLWLNLRLSSHKLLIITELKLLQKGQKTSIFPKLQKPFSFSILSFAISQHAQETIKVVDSQLIIKQFHLYSGVKKFFTEFFLPFPIKPL